MSFRYVKDFQSQVMAVRRHHAGKDARPGERIPISGEGSALLAMIDGLPEDGVVVSPALLSAVRKVKAIGQNPGPHLVILTEDEQKAWDGA